MSNTSSKKPVKVMVFGTFDGLHKGHENFFLQARKLSPDTYLIVSMARDKNVFKIKKRKPIFSENKRLKLVEKCILVDKVVLGGVKNYFPHILKEKPDIIALGYDQKVYVFELKKDLRNKNMKTRVVRLKPYKEKIYKSHLLIKK